MERKMIGKYERQEILLDQTELHNTEIIQLVPPINWSPNSLQNPHCLLRQVLPNILQPVQK